MGCSAFSAYSRRTRLVRMSYSRYTFSLNRPIRAFVGLGTVLHLLRCSCAPSASWKNLGETGTIRQGPADFTPIMTPRTVLYAVSVSVDKVGRHASWIERLIPHQRNLNRYDSLDGLVHVGLPRQTHDLPQTGVLPAKDGEELSVESPGQRPFLLMFILYGMPTREPRLRGEARPIQMSWSAAGRRPRGRPLSGTSIQRQGTSRNRLRR